MALIDKPPESNHIGEEASSVDLDPNHKKSSRNKIIGGIVAALAVISSVVIFGKGDGSSDTEARLTATTTPTKTTETPPGTDRNLNQSPEKPEVTLSDIHPIYDSISLTARDVISEFLTNRDTIVNGDLGQDQSTTNKLLDLMIAKEAAGERDFIMTAHQEVVNLNAQYPNLHASSISQTDSVNIIEDHADGSDWSITYTVSIDVAGKVTDTQLTNLFVKQSHPSEARDIWVLAATPEKEIISQQ